MNPQASHHATRHDRHHQPTRRHDLRRGLSVTTAAPLGHNHDDANDYATAGAAIERRCGQPSGAIAAHQLATLEFVVVDNNCDQLHNKHQQQQQQVGERRAVRGLTRQDEFLKKEEALISGCSDSNCVGEQLHWAREASSERRQQRQQKQQQPALNHCAAVPEAATRRRPSGEGNCAPRERAAGEASEHLRALEFAIKSECGTEAQASSNCTAVDRRGKLVNAAGASGNNLRNCSSNNLQQLEASEDNQEQEQLEAEAQESRHQEILETHLARESCRNELQLAEASSELPEASDIRKSVGAAGAPPPLFQAINNSTALIGPLGEPSFWRRLSNLSRSIAHQQATRDARNPPASSAGHNQLLAPEVVGYLKRKCRGRQDVTGASCGDAEELASNMTAASESVAHNEPDQRHLRHARAGGETLTPTTTTSTTKRRRNPPAEQQQQQQQQQVTHQMAGHQAPSSNQRLIRIVEMPAAVKMAHKSQPEAAAVAGQGGLTTSSPALNLEDPPQNQVKLSIATTITTSASNSGASTATRSSSGATSLSSCILASDSTSIDSQRLKWGKKMDFLLSIIGFAVDLANIWRFPYLVYKNGGGVFLIPYLTMLIFGGIPLFFLELCLGQFVKKGPITVWNKICPYMKGVGYCSILISWYVSFYYNVLIAWSVYFIYRSISSFGEKMPWEDCDNSWNTKATCVSISQLKTLCSTRNETLEACRKDLFSNINVTSPASEFFVKELSQIDQSTGLEDMGYLRPELVVCTMIVYLLHYFSLFRGLETSGKVVWVTATAPYMILSILLVRGLFLPGASVGIEYYLSPKLEKLADPQVWIDAAGQVFYSIGVGFGVHLTFASFNSHDNNCYRDCLMTSAVNALTSVYSGLVVFVYLGYMATNLGIEIDKVASEGYSLVFEVYPEALTTLPFARFWSILFFIMLLTLGIDSAMGGLEAVITGLEDEFRFAKRLSRGQLTGLVIFSSFLPALISCTQGGAYTLFWFDIYSAGVSLLFSALFETIGVVYCYGLDKFILNIESMLGQKPGLFYILCWKYISPLFLMGIIFMSIYTASVPVYRGYTFPVWSIVLGWCLAFSSVAAVPIVAIYTWCASGSKALSVTPSKSPRKQAGGGSSYGPSGSRNSVTRKSPSAHGQCKTTAVNYNATGATQVGLGRRGTGLIASGGGGGGSGGGGGGGFGQLTTTNIISSSNEHRIREDML